jgi:hypothetical protein
METAIELAENAELNPKIALAIQRALTEYLLGHGTKVDCFEQERGCAISTYYNWRSEYPDLVQAIEDRARLNALKNQYGEDVAFQARQKRRSQHVQEEAMRALEDDRVVGMLFDLILGVPRTSVIEQDNGELDVKRIHVYPRDQIEAFRRLRELARGGVRPEITADGLDFLDRLPMLGENKRRAMEDFRQQPEEQPRGVTLDDIAPSAQFTRITAETTDGRTFTAEVKHDEVLDGKVIVEE